jgi:hypothetical protein
MQAVLLGIWIHLQPVMQMYSSRKYTHHFLLHPLVTPENLASIGISKLTYKCALTSLYYLVHIGSCKQPATG